MVRDRRALYVRHSGTVPARPTGGRGGLYHYPRCKTLAADTPNPCAAASSELRLAYFAPAPFILWDELGRACPSIGFC